MERSTFGNTRWIAICCTALIAALWAVGVVSAEPLRHLIQTLPIWIAVVLAMRKADLGKWVALAFFIFWLFLMMLIWLYLLGWARVVSGTFSPTEIGLTLTIGLISSLGIMNCLRLRSSTGPLTASAIFLLSAALQALAIRVSILPAIAHR